MLPPDPIVINIGAGAGTSGLAFMESRDDLILKTVDIVWGDSPFGCLSAERLVLSEAGFSIDLDDDECRYESVLDNSILYARSPWFQANKVDMVFIDGDHSYEGCSGDIMAWLPNIKLGGILAIHDYDKAAVFARGNWTEDAPHPQPWPGVDKAVNELIEAGYEIIKHVDTLIAFRVNREK